MAALAAVVFDLDYTLAVTTRTRQAVLDEATNRAGTHAIDREDYLEAHGAVDATETRTPIFEQLLDDETVTADALTTAYREAIEATLTPVPGAANLVQDLRREYQVGLLTDGPLVAQRSKLHELGWSELFDAVVITGSLPAGKPDHGAFEAICRELTVESVDVVYVGDRPEVDIEGAASAGLRTVQVCYPDGPDPHPAADATVDRADMVERLPELLRVL